MVLSCYFCPVLFSSVPVLFLFLWQCCCCTVCTSISVPELHWTFFSFFGSVCSSDHRTGHDIWHTTFSFNFFFSGICERWSRHGTRGLSPSWRNNTGRYANKNYMKRAPNQHRTHKTYRAPKRTKPIRMYNTIESGSRAKVNMLLFWWFWARFTVVMMYLRTIIL